MANNPPEAGRRADAVAAEAKTSPRLGAGKGYSGHEYDSDGVSAWLAEDRRQALDPSGEVRGSGSGTGGGHASEDYDSDAAAGSGYPRTGAPGEEKIADASQNE